MKSKKTNRFPKKPNKETVKALNETKQGKGLVHCTDFKDFLEKLG